MSQNNNKAEFEIFDASSYKVGIVVAQFNKSICEAMLEEAQKECDRYNIKNVDIFRVAGSVEIPVILQGLAKSEKYDCLVAIGVIIRGDTAHFDYVAKMATEGVLQIQLEHTIPVGLGILTLENVSQAEERIIVGKDATEAAIQSAKILQSI